MVYDSASVFPSRALRLEFAFVYLTNIDIGTVNASQLMFKLPHRYAIVISIFEIIRWHLSQLMSMSHMDGDTATLLPQHPVPRELRLGTPGDV